MKRRRTIGGFVGSAVIVLGFGGVPAMAGEGGGEDPFAAVQAMAEGDLETLRGGDDTIIESFNTTITTSASNEVNAEIGEINFNGVGDITGGNVTISDNALGSFHGIATQSFATAPGNNVTATTAMTIYLVN